MNSNTAVGNITLYSGPIGGLLAWQCLYANGKPFIFLTWLVLTLGLFIAHGTNNLINDYMDFSRGIDKDNYFRVRLGRLLVTQSGRAGSPRSASCITAYSATILCWGSTSTRC